jgi:phage FluMu protein Com
MALQKYGVASKIRTVASNEKEYEELRDNIINTNNLVRCNRCGKLLAKVSDDMISVKRKDVDLVMKAAEAKIRCPVCSTVNNVVKE